MSTEYSGWRNYPTWNVKLWLDNEEAPYKYFTNMANELVKQEAEKLLPILDVDGEESTPEALMREALICYVHDHHPLETDTSMYGDMLSWAIDQVDWDEIADAYIDEARLQREQA